MNSLFLCHKQVTRVFSPISLSWKRKQIPYWSKWAFFLSFEHLTNIKQYLVEKICKIVLARFVKTCCELDLSVALEFSPNFWSPLISLIFSWIWSKSAPFCTSLFFLVRFSYIFWSKISNEQVLHTPSTKVFLCTPYQKCRVAIIAPTHF